MVLHSDLDGREASKWEGGSRLWALQMGGTGAEAAIWGRSIEGSLSFPPESSKFAIFLLLGLLSFFPKKREKDGKEEVFEIN